ncbi:MAG: 3-deoxy-manno-octulosonate cytidylyltransferase [bacterium]|nr:3-deoxy-manno-octulosonate cytidylyltransferase [bacterium]
MRDTLVVIPARYSSTRFPGKPLAKIAGRSMVLRVCDQIKCCKQISDFVVATDDERIFEEVKSNGYPVVMTAVDHQSGTDRIAEVAKSRNESWILNIQGDEPFLDPHMIDKFLIEFHSKASNCLVGTIACPINSLEDHGDVNVVKVVLRHNQKALYFSRSQIPCDRDKLNSLQHCYRHLGVYLYERDTLLSFSQLPPSDLEQIEKLEQLRLLQAGYDLYVHIVDEASFGIDTPEDLSNAEQYFQKIKIKGSK